MTVAELQRLRAIHDHWAVAWSGGKDSTALATVTGWAIESGQVERPKSLKLIRSDTRQELAPLNAAAEEIGREFAERGWEVVTVEPPQDKGLWVNTLGRGVTRPNNMKARWCTRQLKQDPMAEYLKGWIATGVRPLTLIGLRSGESDQRDRSMAVACTRNGGECGQARFYFDLPEELTARDAPIRHWKTCRVWAWLKNYAPNHQYGEWPTQLVADVYGGQGETEKESDEKAIRTGCVECPLATTDKALAAVIALPHWAYLEPLQKLRGIWDDMSLPRHRLRKRGYTWGNGDWVADGDDQRQGPIRLESRLLFLERVLAIQAEVNDAAERLDRPKQWVIPPNDEARIRELVAMGTWPRGWDGTEPEADEPMHEVRPGGIIQLNMFADS